jgi:hypothetical protein
LANTVITHREGEKGKATKKNTALHSVHCKPHTTHSKQSDIIRHVESCHMACVDIDLSAYMALTNLGQSPAAEAASLHLALQNPTAFHCLLKDEDTFSIIWDSGASICISHGKKQLCWNALITRHHDILANSL